MSRTFMYARVSTSDQTTANQVAEVRAAGFDIDGKRVIEESISGSTAATLRPQFIRLLDRLETGDTLVITKIDRLGRDTVDVVSTIRLLSGLGVRTVCLQLGSVDLTSSSGQMILGILATIAQFEKSLLVERVQSGLARARSQGVRLGRRPALNDRQRQDVLAALAAGTSVSALAREHGTSRTTIIRAKKTLADVGNPA
jgi:putative DNA-invertase from lambdoid prophage Rac